MPFLLLPRRTRIKICFSTEPEFLEQKYYEQFTVTFTNSQDYAQKPQRYCISMNLYSHKDKTWTLTSDFRNKHAFLGQAIPSIYGTLFILVWVPTGYTVYETANSFLPPLGDVNQVYCLEYTAFCSLGAQEVSKQLFKESISHRAHRARDEIGRVHLPSQLDGTLQLCSWW